MGAEAVQVAPLIEQAAGRLREAGNVLLTCHLGPDGDSIGSMIALASLLRDQGKRATLWTSDLVPRRFKWMPLLRSLIHKLPADARYDLTVVVDVADAKLLGDHFPAREITGPVMALDHHHSAAPFGDLWVWDPAAASVGVLVARIAHHLGWRITRDAAVGMMVSMVTDTGSFRYSNTDAEALRLAAELVDLGVTPWEIAEQMTERVPLARYRLLAAALATLEPAAGGALCFMTVTDEMVKQAGASWEDSEGLVNYARSIDGVECGVLLTPAKRGGTRVSLRSKGRLIDAGAVCAALGGGGHVGAAGCTLAATLPETRARVEAALVEALARARST